MPLGYACREKRLVVIEEEAARVRLIFELYLELGSLGHLLPELRRRGVVTKLRQLSTGRTIGGIPFTRGPLAHLLRNRYYLGEVVYRGKLSPGEHPAILEGELFDGCSWRHVNMTISLAFLAPHLVRAAGARTGPLAKTGENPL